MRILLGIALGDEGMRSFRIAVGLFALLLASTLAAQPVQVKDVRIAHTGDRTRIVLDLDNAADHNLFTLANPNRVVVDIASARFDGAATKLPTAIGLVGNMRAANRDNGMARLVLDLDEAVRPKSFALQPGAGYGHRLVVDLYALDAQPAAVKTSPRKSQVRDLVVAIDAGHGGKDPGARGRGGLLEKDAVLDISKRLASLIEAEPGMRPYLTRKGDSFLKLGERMRRAQNAGADLFISIHADAFSDRNVRGASVYVLSNKGASDEAAHLLAARENAADTVGGVTLNDKDDTLAAVLVDLSQNASLEASIEVGDLLIGELSRVGKVRRPTVQKAGFKVLKSADIPSVLIETAFISNAHDESNLRSVQYQQRLASAMHSGIRNYFYANPPEGTRVAVLAREQKQIREHIIRQGDTLSGIAQRYNVSVSGLRAANQLNTSNIRIGQVLRIPPAQGARGI